MTILILRAIALWAMILVAAGGCRKSPPSASLLEIVEKYREQGIDPRQNFSEFSNELKRECAQDSQTCETARFHLVCMYFSWGRFEEAWSFYRSASGPMQDIGLQVILIRRALHSGDSAAFESRPDWSSVSSILNKSREGTLTGADVAKHCRVGDISVAMAFSLAMLAEGRKDAAHLAAVIGLKFGLASLRQEQWSDVDLGSDVGVMADCIVLWRIYAATGGNRLQGPENDSTTAAARAESLYKSFHGRKERSTRERAYLESTWAIVEKLLHDKSPN